MCQVDTPRGIGYTLIVSGSSYVRAFSITINNTTRVMLKRISKTKVLLFFITVSSN